MEQKSSGFDGRTLSVILICAAVWFGWQQYLERKYPETMGSQRKEQERPLPQPVPAVGANGAAATELIAGAEKTEKGTKQNARGPEQKWTYEDSNWRVVVSSYGGRVSEVQLKNYTDRSGQPIRLLNENLPGYLITDVEGAAKKPEFSKMDYKVTAVSKEAVELSAESEGLQIKKTLTVVPEKYIIKSQTTVSGALNSGEKINFLVEEEGLKESQQQSGGLSFLNRGAGQELQEYFFSHGSKTNRLRVTLKDPVNQTYEQTSFASVGSRYFTTVLFNRSNVLPVGDAYSADGNSVLKLSYPVLDPSSAFTVNLDLYAGPKVLGQLKQLDDSASQVVDFGMFSWIAVPLLELMKLFFNIFKNYGVAIIALTVLVRTITFPFTYVSYKSMRAMQKIQPEIARLKEIYKDNTATLNQEMMKLMRENKVNPAGGCLPLLLQLPVFWALYQVLQNSIELYHSPFFGWIHDLSLKDPFYVLPILMGISMFIQQKLTPNTMDPAQAKVMLIMPIFFSFLMFSLPAGLTLYIFVSTLFGIIQQVFIMRDRNSAPQQAVMRRG